MGNHTLKLEAPWAEVREMLLEINPELTKEDLDLEADGEDVMLNRLAQKLNKDVPAVKAWIESVSHNRGLAY